MENFEKLIGKKIIDVKLKVDSMFDDKNELELIFSDETSALLIGGYGAYTGKSQDEFPQTIGIVYGEKVAAFKY